MTDKPDPYAMVVDLALTFTALLVFAGCLYGAYAIGMMVGCKP
jgi:hypothetical protein